MKIALVGPGIMSIPPNGWGAVEILIWDYYNILKKLNHDVYIINKIRNNQSEQNTHKTNYSIELINNINSGNYDFVHLHYDCLYHILPFIKANKIGFTSHYPYINKEEKHINDGFTTIFNFMINNNKYLNFVLSTKDMEYLIHKGAKKELLFKLENGINCEAFIFKEKGDLMFKNYLFRSNK